MYHRLASVAPAGRLTIEATFADGTVKRYDVEPLLSRWKAFEALRDVPGLFRSVRVDAGGYGVVWNDELDLECEEIWNNGVSVSGSACSSAGAVSSSGRSPFLCRKFRRASKSSPLMFPSRSTV